VFKPKEPVGRKSKSGGLEEGRCLIKGESGTIRSRELGVVRRFHEGRRGGKCPFWRGGYLQERKGAVPI